MTKTLHGVVRGKTIEVREDLGVAEGQEVELQLKLVRSDRKWGEGILRCAGALADAPEWDKIMDEIYRSRKVERRPHTELE